MPGDAPTISEHLAGGRIPEAVRAAKALSERGTEDRETLLLIAEAYERGGRYLYAARAYETLLARDPSDLAAASRFVVHQLRRGRPDLVQPLIEQVEATAAETPEILAARTAIAEAAGRGSDALALRRRLVELRPDDPEPLAELAVALARAGEMAEAQALLAAAMRRWPGDLYVERATVLVALEEPGKPDMRPWDAYVGRGPVDPDLLADVVAACARRGMVKLAIDVLAEAQPERVSRRVIDALADLLERRGAQAAKDARRLVRRVEGVREVFWVRLFKKLVGRGQYLPARVLVQTLVEDGRAGSAVAEVADIAASLPEQPSGDVARELSTQRALVIVPAPSPAATVFVFTAARAASQLLHTQLAGRDVDVVHVRHRSGYAYLLDGIPDEAEGYADALELLRGIGRRSGGPLYVIGNSGPAFAALRYGIDLEARGILLTSAIIDATTEFMAADARHPRAVSVLRDAVPDMLVNGRSLIEGSANPPRTLVYYGADAARDAAHASQLAGAPGVSLRPVAGEGRHSILYPMLRTGLMAEAIDELLAAGRD